LPAWRPLAHVGPWGMVEREVLLIASATSVLLLRACADAVVIVRPRVRGVLLRGSGKTDALGFKTGRPCPPKGELMLQGVWGQAGFLENTRIRTANGRSHGFLTGRAGRDAPFCDGLRRPLERNVTSPRGRGPQQGRAGPGGGAKAMGNLPATPRVTGRRDPVGMVWNSGPLITFVSKSATSRRAASAIVASKPLRGAAERGDASRWTVGIRVGGRSPTFVLRGPAPGDEGGIHFLVARALMGEGVRPTRGGRLCAAEGGKSAGGRRPAYFPGESRGSGYG